MYGFDYNAAENVRNVVRNESDISHCGSYHALVAYACFPFDIVINIALQSGAAISLNTVESTGYR